MAYLYRHIRLDSNQPFYIGISNVDDDYKRAYKRTCRNKHWTNIIKSTNYDVEILIDNLTIEEAKEKEKEFISLYGRVDLKTGCLVNLTDGGDGGIGKIVSDETKQKLSIAIKEWNKTRVISDYQRQKASNHFKKLNKDTKFQEKRIESLRSSAKLKEYNDSRIGIPSGYKHTEEMKKKLSQLRIGKKRKFEEYSMKCKPLIQLTLDGQFVKEWQSARQVQRETKYLQCNISNCCNGGYKQAYGFKWQYIK